MAETCILGIWKWNCRSFSTSPSCLKRGRALEHTIVFAIVTPFKFYLEDRKICILLLRVAWECRSGVLLIQQFITPPESAHEGGTMESHEPLPPNPVQSANCLSKDMTFWWVNGPSRLICALLCLFTESLINVNIRTKLSSKNHLRWDVTWTHVVIFRVFFLYLMNWMTEACFRTIRFKSVLSVP